MTMKTVCFTIEGNSAGIGENPIPYTRTTQRQKYSDRYKRYTEWKTFVVARYLDVTFPAKRAIKREDFGDVHDLLERKPIKAGVRASVMINIFFAHSKNGKCTHADPDNVVKGIVDALFMDDKHVDVETHHTCARQMPKVEVQIIFNN